MKRTLIFLAGFLLTHVCFAQEQNFRWLLGTWKVKDKDVLEVWTVNKEATQKLSGRAFQVNGADTTLTEVISLEYLDGSYHYIPDVAGVQPPVDFTITSSDLSSFVAENPQHDFPKKIHYQYLQVNGRETIEASIEGNGQIIKYIFEKLK